MKMASRTLIQVNALPPKVARVSQDGAVTTDILQLPDAILQNILVSVGITISLGVVNWKRHSGSHIQEYRKPYTISRCSRLQCSQLYKDCGAGYQGNGQRGVLLGFYSSDDHPGYCSWDCYTDDGGWED